MYASHLRKAWHIAMREERFMDAYAILEELGELAEGETILYMVEMYFS